MASVNPYLNFNGNCEEAFHFYKSVFGGEFTYLGRFGEMPEEHCKDMAEGDKSKIMHVSLVVKGDHIIMGSDVIEGFGEPYNAGNNFALAIGAESKEVADLTYEKLSEGGQKTMPMVATFWGDYFGMLTDKFGMNWMISFNEKYKGNGKTTVA